MRKLPGIAVSALAAALLATAALPAIAEAQGRVFGLKGGLTSSKFLFAHDDEFEGADEFLSNRSSVAGGAFMTFGANRMVGLQVEALYVQKGVSGDADFEGESIEGEMALTYVEVPVLLRVAFPMGSARPYVFAGGAGAMELSCEISLSSGGQTETSECRDEEEGDQSLRTFDLSAVFGAGVELAMGKMILGLDARLTRGLQSLDESGDSDVKNQAILFLASVGFPLGGAN